MSEIRATTISDLVGTGPVTLTGQSAAKSWSNFDGTGTIAARDDYNVSSYTDNGTGYYGINLSNSMHNDDYSRSGLCGENNNAGGNRNMGLRLPSTGSYNIYNGNGSWTAVDVEDVCNAIHGDLA